MLHVKIEDTHHDHTPTPEVVVDFKKVKELHVLGIMWCYDGNDILTIFDLLYR